MNSKGEKYMQSNYLLMLLILFQINGGWGSQCQQNISWVVKMYKIYTFSIISFLEQYQRSQASKVSLLGDHYRIFAAFPLDMLFI